MTKIKLSLSINTEKYLDFLLFYTLYTRGVKLAARGPNVARDVIFCCPRKILWCSANAWPPNLVLEKLFSKWKKSFKLKFRENSDYYPDMNIYFQKSLSGYWVKNVKKSILKALVSKIEIYTAMFLKLFAAEDLQVCRESF